MATVNAKPIWKSRGFWLGALHIIGGLASLPYLPAAVPAIAIVSGLAQVVVRAVTTGPMTATAQGADMINDRLPQSLRSR